jgi:hypothetical protein
MPSLSDINRIAEKVIEGPSGEDGGIEEQEAERDIQTCTTGSPYKLIAFAIRTSWNFHVTFTSLGVSSRSGIEFS